MTMGVQPAAGARSFTAEGDEPVTLVVWDRSSDMHSAGEVWGLFAGGTQLVDLAGLEDQVHAAVEAARDHYGRRLHVVSDQRGLSEVETRGLASAGVPGAE